ncbi:MAG: hypothetical protein J2P58_00165, partial [Acidimicrobiaceae bacterium]|nr:hypothetical protein [Acidimicrobiaceae bacterium]
LMRETNLRGPAAPPGPPTKRIESPDYQRNFGIALETTDAAEAILIRSGEMYSEYSRLFANEGRPFTAEDDVRLWGQCQVAGRLAFDAVELWRTADSSVVGRRGQRLQRNHRDVSGTSGTWRPTSTRTQQAFEPTMGARFGPGCSSARAGLRVPWLSLALTPRTVARQQAQWLADT